MATSIESLVESFLTVRINSDCPEQLLPAEAQLGEDPPACTIPPIAPEQPKLQRKDFIITKKLGEGSFGTVYQATKDGRVCALKVIRKSGVEKAGLQKSLKKEITAQGILDHPNIVHLHNHFHDEKRSYLVLEYAPGGELYKRHLARTISEGRAAFYVIQVCEGLKHLHNRGIIHRDIKAENILFGEDDHVMITDFGFCASSSTRRKTKCGTLDYMAPEIMNLGGYDHKVDIWAVGILMYELLVGKTPFEEEDDITARKKIAMGVIEVPSCLESLLARDLIHKVRLRV